MPFAQVVGPLKAEVDDRAGRVRAGGLSHAALDHLPLASFVADGAEREPERMGDEAGQRRLDQARDVRRLGDRNRRQSLLVEDSLEQPDRLLADRSRGDEEHEVDAVGPQAACHLRAGLAYERPGVGDVTHEGVVARRQLPDRPVGCELAEQRERNTTSESLRARGTS